MSLDMTSFASALKVHYTGDKLENLVYRDNPLFAMIPKYKNFGGKNLPIPVIYGNPQNRSVTFSTAVAGTTASGVKDFTLTRVKDYSIASIDNETLLASEQDSDAFMEAVTVEMDGAIQALSRSISTALYRDGSGAIGNINATVTGTTLTLLNLNDITNFEVGMLIQFSSAATSASLRDSGEALTVTAIDRNAGSMTVSLNLNTISGITSGDYINVKGDIEGKLKGLQAWLPTSVSATSFFGMDRTTDAVRLGGVYYDGSALPIEEALIEGAVRCAREGGAPDVAFMNYSNWANLEKALGSKVSYVDVSAGAQISFRGIQVAGPRGMIKVIPDQNCPSTDLFMLQMNMWKLYTLGEPVRVIDQDGLKMLREASTDSVQVRCAMYGQLGCRAPGFNARVKLS